MSRGLGLSRSDGGARWLGYHQRDRVFQLLRNHLPFPPENTVVRAIVSHSASNMHYHFQEEEEEEEDARAEQDEALSRGRWPIRLVSSAHPSSHKHTSNTQLISISTSTGHIHDIHTHTHTLTQNVHTESCRKYVAASGKNGMGDNKTTKPTI